VTPPPTIRSGERIDYLTPTNAAKLFFSLQFWNKVIATCNSFLNLKGLKLSENNSFLETAAVAPGADIAAFAISTLSGGDYFLARRLSNFRRDTGIAKADVSPIDTKIAKPPTIRRSITSELIDGITINYRAAGGSDDDNNRIANDGATDESQCVYPRFITLATLGFTDTVPLTAQCVIYASQLTGGAGVFDGDDKPIEWLELSPARVWAKRFVA
jgi:hypothetical protein